MPTLASFLITRKWPARHPDRLLLYSLPTPNGVKVSIMLEELGLPCEAHRVSFETQDQLSPEFLRSTRTTRSRPSSTRKGRAARRWPPSRRGQRWYAA